MAHIDQGELVVIHTQEQNQVVGGDHTVGILGLDHGEIAGLPGGIGEPFAVGAAHTGVQGVGVGGAGHIFLFRVVAQTRDGGVQTFHGVDVCPEDLVGGGSGSGSACLLLLVGIGGGAAFIGGAALVEAGNAHGVDVVGVGVELRGGLLVAGCQSRVVKVQGIAVGVIVVGGQGTHLHIAAVILDPGAAAVHGALE